MRFINYIAVFSFLVLISFQAQAQTVLGVVSKAVEKEFPFKIGQMVVVEGERAEIKIETWEKNTISVKLTLIAKHPQKATAEKELKSFDFSFEDKGDKLVLRNYYANSTKATSELSAVYTVIVPTECPVQMSNYFGKTDVQDLSNSFEIDSKFGPVAMTNLSGIIDVSSRFGDIFGDFLSGKVKIESHRSNITLKHLEGSFDINSKYGIIKIFADNKIIDLNIEAEKSDVYLFNPDPSEFGYDLLAHFGDITVPEDLKINFVEKNDKMSHAVRAPGTQFPGVFVKITFGDIIVKKAQP